MSNNISIILFLFFIGLGKFENFFYHSKLSTISSQNWKSYLKEFIIYDSCVYFFGICFLLSLFFTQKSFLIILFLATVIIITLGYSFSQGYLMNLYKDLSSEPISSRGKYRLEMTEGVRTIPKYFVIPADNSTTRVEIAFDVYKKLILEGKPSMSTFEEKVEIEKSSREEPEKLLNVIYLPNSLIALHINLISASEVI